MHFSNLSRFTLTRSNNSYKFAIDFHDLVLLFFLNTQIIFKNILSYNQTLWVIISEWMFFSHILAYFLTNSFLHIFICLPNRLSYFTCERFRNLPPIRNSQLVCVNILTFNMTLLQSAVHKYICIYRVWLLMSYFIHFDFITKILCLKIGKLRKSEIKISISKKSSRFLFDSIKIWILMPIFSLYNIFFSE